LSDLADVMEKYRLPKEAWIETIFKRYLHLPDDVVNAFITALPTPVEGADAMQGESLRRPGPYTAKLLREIESEAGRNPRIRFLTGQLRACALGNLSEGANERGRRRIYKSNADVLGMPSMQENDMVINSMGQHPLQLRQADGSNPLKRSAMPLQEHLDEALKTNGHANGEPAYRRYMPEKF